MKSLSKKDYLKKHSMPEEFLSHPDKKGCTCFSMGNIRKWLGKKRYGAAEEQQDEKDFSKEFPIK